MRLSNSGLGKIQLALVLFASIAPAGEPQRIPVRIRDPISHEASRRWAPQSRAFVYETGIESDAVLVIGQGSSPSIEVSGLGGIHQPYEILLSSSDRKVYGDYDSSGRTVSTPLPVDKTVMELVISLSRQGAVPLLVVSRAQQGGPITLSVEVYHPPPPVSGCNRIWGWLRGLL